MTSPEHTLVGVIGALALGLHKRFGWPVVVFAGVASNLPDWDGLPMLLDMEKFESGHRVWGHNFVSIVVLSLVLAFAQFRFRIVERVAVRLRRWLPKEVSIPDVDSVCRVGFVALTFVAIGFQAVHLLCDITVSGGKGLTDWAVLPWWPISDEKFVFSLIPWGDVGPTVIMMATLILAAKWKERVQQVSCGGMVLLVVYMFFRGWQRGAFG